MPKPVFVSLGRTFSSLWTSVRVALSEIGLEPRVYAGVSLPSPGTGAVSKTYVEATNDLNGVYAIAVIVCGNDTQVENDWAFSAFPYLAGISRPIFLYVVKCASPLANLVDLPTGVTIRNVTEETLLDALRADFAPLAH